MRFLTQTSLQNTRYIQQKGLAMILPKRTFPEFFDSLILNSTVFSDALPLFVTECIMVQLSRQKSEIFIMN